jgi:aryl carrier-like protein
MRETSRSEGIMSDKELEALRAGLIMGIEHSNTLIAEYGLKIKHHEDLIDQAEDSVKAITEQLRLRKLVAFCNTPSLFAPIV